MSIYGYRQNGNKLIIELDIYEKLEAPPEFHKDFGKVPFFENQNRRHYLPCDICGKIQIVWWNVVSTLCLDCSDKKFNDPNYEPKGYKDARE